MTNEINETANAIDEIYEAVDELVDLVWLNEDGEKRFDSREEAQGVAAKLIRCWGQTLNISEFASKEAV